MRHLAATAFIAAAPFLGPTATAQSAEEIALAKVTLGALQAISFTEKREFCGYFAYDAADNLVATPATRGTLDSCAYEGPEDGLVLVISYHTHGNYDTSYAAEIPSVDDYETDEEEGVDGFVATPGGRLWYVDTADELVRQICGLGCLPQDPDFKAGDWGEIEISYTYEELLEWWQD
ncbi:MAG: DUF4329 domain-containing protein [Pseudomonadota bacterium]